VILRLPFGRDAITADLRGLRCRLLVSAAPRISPDTRALVAAALDEPAGTSPLVELARGRHRVAVLVPDTTRRLPLAEICRDPRPSRGGRRSGTGITIVVACGTTSGADGQLTGLLGPLPRWSRCFQTPRRHRARSRPHWRRA
jgi:hypothetical protein